MNIPELFAGGNIPAPAYPDRRTARPETAEAENNSGAMIHISESAQILQPFRSLQLSSSVSSAASFSVRASGTYSRSESLTVNGTHTSSSAMSTLEMTYRTSKQVIEDGKAVTKWYQMSVIVSGSSQKEFSVSKTQEKEDIVTFSRRLFDRVWDIAKDKKKLLAGIELSAEDIKDLAAMDNGKTLAMLFTLLRALRLMAEQQIHDAPAQKIILRPKREQWTTIETTRAEISSLNIQISMTEIQPPDERTSGTSPSSAVS